MIYFLLVMLLLFGLVLYLPIRVEVNTEQQIYRIEWLGIMAVWAIPEELRWRWFFKIFFWQKEWQPSQKAPKSGLMPKKKQRGLTKDKSNFSIQQGKALFRQLMKTVRLEYLRINWDTGDFVLNAWLYPAFRMASKGARQLNINFKGEQILAFRLFTRPGILAMGGIRFFFMLKK